MSKAAIWIGVLGTIFTAANTFVAMKQYEAADLQAKVALAALVPQLEVRSVLHKSGKDYYTDRRLQIQNEGGPIYNFATSMLTWATVKDSRSSPPSEFTQPLLGYYHSVFPSSRIKGELTTITGFRNNEKYAKLESKVRDLTNKSMSLGPPTTLLRATFKDSLSRETSEFFLISGGSIQRLVTGDGERLWLEAIRREKLLGSVDLDRLIGDQEIVAWLAHLRSQGIERR